ncbi:probable N-acetyltransferase CML6 [Diachasma alloeum]|uniref:probable N-acetyltransferase CML6 n=1 Tax=Diachasma alloeum TaxID=454923 RepID=UPI000738513E|nr:probable N-acetyltransferase CML6 [Diachasma alloeum]
MSHIVVIRGYKPGDELHCRDMIKDAIMTSFNSAFIANLFKEVTFQLMILCAAIMFIFFGLPFSVCLLVIPIVIFSTYAATYLGFVMIAAATNQEITNVPRIYMSNAFSCFWVAEAFQPHLMMRSPKDYHYTVMTEQQFREGNIDVSSQARRIVGTVGLLKSYKVEKGAWIKRLFVEEKYRRKGIGSALLSTALQFAIDEGYSCADLVTSEYAEGGRELCFKKGFELKQMYHKQIIGPMVSYLLYELTYQIKEENDYYSRGETKNMLLKFQ